MASDDNLLWLVLGLVAAVLLVPVLLMAFMMPMVGMWSWGHMADGWAGGNAGGSWTWLLVWLFMVAVVGGVGYLLYRVIRRSADDDSDSALEELRIAYARGDLTDEEFKERRERLRREK